MSTTPEETGVPVLTYYAIQPFDMGDGDVRQPGDLIPELLDIPSGRLMIGRGAVGTVLTCTLPAEMIAKHFGPKADAEPVEEPVAQTVPAASPEGDDLPPFAEPLNATAEPVVKAPAKKTAAKKTAAKKTTSRSANPSAE